MSQTPDQRMFISDIDGTLLTSGRQLAAVDLAALIELRRHRVKVVLATGRSEASFSRHLERLALPSPVDRLPIDYLIFSTGAGVIDFNEPRLLRAWSLSGNDLRAALAAVESLELDHMIHRPIPDTAHFLYRRYRHDNPDFLRRLKLYASVAAPFSRQALADYGGATEILAIVPGPHGHELAAQLTELLPMCSVIKATSPLDHQSLWIEIFNRQVSKSNAARWLAGLCGINREQVCAIGNDYNDEDLLAWAGQAFVVAGAPLPLRQRFAPVAGNDHGGVAEAVTRWLTNG